MYARVIFAIVAVICSVAVADAQEPAAESPLVVGSRVRLTYAGEPGLIRGIVVAVDGSFLTLAPDDRAPLKVPLDSVDRVEVSVGRKRHTLRGLVIGGASMAALGATWSVDPDDCGADSLHYCSRAEAIGFGALFGVILGAGIGALIETEQWAPLPVRIRGSTGGGPEGRAAELGLSIPF